MSFQLLHQFQHLASMFPFTGEGTIAHKRRGLTKQHHANTKHKDAD